MSQFYSSQESIYQPGMSTKRVKVDARTRRRYDDKKIQTVKHKAGANNIGRTSIAPRNPHFKPGYFKSHLPGVPQKFSETLRWFVQPAQYTVAASTYANPYQIVMNGAFDPDLTLGATQPAAFAKLMALYTKCCVKSCKITVDVTSEPLAGVYRPIVWGIAVSTTTGTAPATLVQAITGGPNTYKLLFSNPDTQRQTISVDMARYLQVDDLFDNPDYSSTVAANPAQVVIGNIFFDNATAASGFISAKIQVDFECTFYDPTLIV